MSKLNIYFNKSKKIADNIKVNYYNKNKKLLSDKDINTVIIYKTLTMYNDNIENIDFKLDSDEFDFIINDSIEKHNINYYDTVDYKALKKTCEETIQRIY
ncbi:hypothetical protein [Alcanivorax sp.]|uniref:hypothetical protein n=1 Tax=Alcanivorax sp. TaxID=1872427 RepID=UPI0025C5E108|nr:hypothetical protein [Alcanivorax sp.]